MDARITEVVERQLGSALDAPALAGDHLVVVADTSDFDDLGSLQVEAEVVAYISTDPDTGIIQLAAPLGLGHPQDAPVVCYPAAVERLAVLVGSADSDDEGGMLARVPHALYDRLPVGVRTEAQGETVQADYSLDDLLITDVTGQAPLVDGSYIDPATLPAAPPPATSDGIPPASSPAVTLVPGLGTIHALWPGIANHDPVTYQVHLSRLAGFTPDSTTLVAQIDGTGLTIRTDPTAGNAPLDSSRQPDGTPTTIYYIRVIATDVDGAGPAGPQSSSTPAQVTGPDIAAGTVTADNIAANTITADLLASTIVMASQMIVTPSTTGQRVEISPAGIRLIAADGTVLVDLPTDPSRDPSFSGDVVTGGLTVTGGARIQGATNVMEKGSALSLQAQLTAPGGGPDVSLQYDMLTTGVYAAVGQPYCMDFDPAGRLVGGGTGPTYLFACNGPGGSPMFQVVEYDPAAGAISRQWTTSVSAALDYTPAGISRVGSYIVFAYWNFDTGSTYIRIYNQATGAIYSGPTAITTGMFVNANVPVHMGTDGTYLLFVAWSGTTAGTSPPKVTRYSMPGGAPTFVDTFNLTGSRFTYQAPWAGTTGANRLITGITGRDGSNYCMASYRILSDGVTYITTYELFSQATHAKLTTPGFDWSPDCMDTTSSNLAAVWKGGVTYETGASAGYRGLDSNNGHVIKYSGWVWDPGDGATNSWWAGYTLFQSAGPYETKITGRTTIRLDGANPASGVGGVADVAMRGKLRVITAPVPSDANGVRVYDLRSAAAPAVTSLRQQTPLVTTAPPGSPVTLYLGAWDSTGPVYVDANTFPAGTSVITADPGAALTATWRLGGDGTLLLSRMTVAQRPAAPARGELHWNETAGNPEAWDGSGYMPVMPVSSERQVYAALRDLGAGVGVPIAYNMDPAFGVTTIGLTNNRLCMFAVMVPRTATCTGLFYFLDTGGSGLAASNTYCGLGLWQFNAAGDAVFLRDSGLTDGTLFSPGSVGMVSRAWAQGTIVLTPDVVYLAGFCQMQVAGSNATLRGVGAAQVNGLLVSGQPFFRSGGVAGIATGTRAFVMKTWTEPNLVQFTNVPFIGLY